MPPDPTTTQKIVRHTLRWTTPILVLAALGGTTMDGIFAGGRLWSNLRPSAAVESPDHRYRALIYVNGEHDHAAGVIVEHQWHGIYLGQFSAMATDDPIDRIVILWAAPDRLAIRCDQCLRESTEIAKSNWGNLHFSYDLGKAAR
ncbi:hypothetical protein [Terriglobus aquaticus]|uniref:hypothetical protein n=1 Tax=Terriglobus aquaticus TaxID=940139 RepID=UPI0021DF6949|nr:hypothetical protein [Terriglobus aquaticus]